METLGQRGSWPLILRHVMGCVIYIKFLVISETLNFFQIIIVFCCLLNLWTFKIVLWSWNWAWNYSSSCCCCKNSKKTWKKNFSYIKSSNHTAESFSNGMFKMSFPPLPSHLLLYCLYVSCFNAYPEIIFGVIILQNSLRLYQQKGRAIQVAGSISERKSSMDIRRPLDRDSDVVIQVI